jgi:hypothetical protein
MIAKRGEGHGAMHIVFTTMMCGNGSPEARAFFVVSRHGAGTRGKHVVAGGGSVQGHAKGLHATAGVEERIRGFFGAQDKRNSPSVPVRNDALDECARHTPSIAEQETYSVVLYI